MSNIPSYTLILVLLFSWRSLVLNIAIAAKYNSIDACWRGDARWASDRMRLACCALGYGRQAYGGKNGNIYVVTNSSDDAKNPAPGTLRYGVTRKSPTWVYFAHDMSIRLKAALYVSSYTTIDARGASVAIGDGPCLVLRSVRHVIIHGLRLSKCSGGYDGDAITITGSRHVWVDHNTLSDSYDGLVDVVHGSTAVTISNNYFLRHDKVMLFGHSDSHVEDVMMRVTVAFNRFGPELVQRMPRCRHGYFHIVNNDYYYGWQDYAIGGSAAPTIISVGNRFKASTHKQVTKCEGNTRECKAWVWRSINDTFLNDSYFVESGSQPKSFIEDGLSFNVQFKQYMTSSAGVLACSINNRC